MSEVKVNKLSPRSGTTVTLGDSGDTFAITSGASISGFTSTGIDDNATSTAITIDSSENVLVGKTSSSDAPGIELLQNGTIDLQASNSILAYFNRTGSDGTLVEFHRSGVVKGLISSRSGFIDIGNDDAGLRFEGSNNAINPRNPTTGDNSDNSLDLGKSASRFKDLYLGGGAFIGGTGTANKLDDYEEGTWTPALGDGTYGYSIQEGTYTKIGNRVFVEFRMDLSSATPGTNFLRFGSLPFAPTDSNAAGSIRLENVNFNSSASYLILCNRAVGSGELVIQEIFANSGDQTVSSADISSTSELRGSICFDTSA